MGEFNFDDEKFYLSDTKNTLTSEVIETNPILRSDVYEINGTKIAYLMYNSFIHGYDKDVIEQFESYKAQGVTELVLDFRYNGGGSVASAMNIASMIAPKSAIGKVFLKKMYNNKMQDYISTNPDNYSNLGPEALYDNLTSEAYYYDNEDPVKDIILPNLDLNRVYVIGLSGTASASELVINGLKPYMKVSTIGKQTHGKYVASITLENKTYKNWAIQPIVFKSANADDETDYWNGFAPDIDMVDHPIIGDFGYNKTYGGFEPLLAAAINDILGVSSKKQQYPEVAKPVGNIEVSDRLSKTMIYDIK
jgi:C-terminal processing protease CtpA/Prc